MPAPWLLVALVAELVALVAVVALAGVDAARTLELHLVNVALASALAGAQRPLERPGRHGTRPSA